MMINNNDSNFLPTMIMHKWVFMDQYACIEIDLGNIIKKKKKIYGYW
jgi:hypothetical protein